MPTRPPTHRPARTTAVRLPDMRESACKRGYDRHWQRLRLSHLAQHPLCVACAERGVVMQASEVDHITPHCGDRELLMDRDNLQSMCKPCHSRKTVKQDGGLGHPRTGSN